MSQAKERPILFSGPMVRAILEGRKTVTRRPVKPQPEVRMVESSIPMLTFKNKRGGHWLYPNARAQIIADCPHGLPGDRLWVREAWAQINVAQAPGESWVVYRECDNRTDYGGPWKPSIHMRRRDSRILLEITDVRVERLNDISEEQAIAEGVEYCPRLDPAGTCHWLVYGKEGTGTNSPAFSFQSLWESINGVGSFDANPWVWVVEFKRIQP